MDAGFLVIDFEASCSGGGKLVRPVTARMNAEGIDVTAVNCVFDCNYLRQLDFLLENNDIAVVLGAPAALKQDLEARETDVLVTRGDKPVVMLPYSESALVILESLVFPTLKQKKKASVVTRVFHAFGVTASECREKLAELLKVKRKIQIIFSEKVMECDIILRYPTAIPPLEAEFTIAEICKKLSQNIYGEGAVSLESAVIERLTAKGLTLALTESYTGGGVASRLISVPGASKCLLESVVAYSDEAKMLRLDVPEKTLKEFSAVSLEAAFEMAAGLLTELSPDVVLATTGYAGPGGANVGKCFLAVGDADSIRLSAFDFKGDRAFITECGIKTALFNLLLYINTQKKAAPDAEK